MRYLCNDCKRYIKDKFIFGLLHICIEPEKKPPDIILGSSILHELDNKYNSPQIEEYNKFVKALGKY